MASTTERGYGWTHQQLRAQLIADLAAHPGQPCGRCGHPMYVEQQPHLDHTEDRTGYRGLAHADCNRVAGARKGGRIRRRLAQRRTATPSRDW